jgi:dsRNA-specific ribonuclease
MNEENKKLEAIGDGLLLAIARLYLRDRHRDIPYSLYTRLMPRMVSNKVLTGIARAEGMTGDADALEVEIARNYYQKGFRDTKRWLWSLFDSHLDIREAVRVLTDPEASDHLLRMVTGALRNSISTNGGKITRDNLDGVAKHIVSRLNNGHSL